VTPLLLSRRGTSRPIPATDVRAAVKTLREQFEDIVAAGGKHTTYFLHGSRRHTGERIRDLVDRVDDPILTQCLIRVADRWDETFAHAPPKRGSRSYRPSTHYSPEDEAETKSLHEVSDIARKGARECLDVFVRLNELERDLVRKERWADRRLRHVRGHPGGHRKR
jgi:hypothetical protein